MGDSPPPPPRRRIPEHDACGTALLARLDGRPTRGLVDDALEALRRMTHRSGAHEGTGDGSGILLGLPHAFLERAFGALLPGPFPDAGGYGVGMFFLPREADGAATCRRAVEVGARSRGLEVAAWRPVPVVAEVPGAAARAVEPRVEQALILPRRPMDTDELERRLFLARKLATRRLRSRGMGSGEFHPCSMSARTVVYKGQLTPAQLPGFYPDLREPELATHVALVHTRFSTNTFPSWSRAQPFRLLGHNGEINTLRGNVNWMRAREPLLRSRLLGETLGRVLPVVDRDTSDSGMLDNVLELMLRAGRPLPESILALVPPAWENDPDLPSPLRDFHRAQASLVEPWDGPAAILFTDGVLAGGILDRNGLRPARWWVTRDRRLILASEVGVVDIPPGEVVRKGRLGPGRILVADLESGRLMGDREVKATAAAAHPWGDWLEAGAMGSGLPDPSPDRGHPIPAGAEGTAPPPPRSGASSGGGPAALAPRSAPPAEAPPHPAVLRAFGYTREQVERLLQPMALEGKDPVGSMGNDQALACLSDRARLPYDYLRQRFAQVTNPPIDSIRERVVTSLACPVGPQGNLLEPAPEAMARLWLDSPILTAGALERLREGFPERGWRTATLSLRMPVAGGAAGLTAALESLCGDAAREVEGGAAILVLSDRGIDAEHAPVSALLAVGAIHHDLIRRRLRGRTALILDSGEPREVHHLCALLGYGADAIHPWLALDLLREEVVRGRWQGVTPEEARRRWTAAAEAGILKVMAKMGISTLSSYKGAQIFEALGLGPDVVELCFGGTDSRVGGVSLEALGEETLLRHRAGWPDPAASTEEDSPPLNEWGGEFAWRPDGEERQWNPGTIANLQQAARRNSREAYREYSRLCHQEGAARATLRSLLDFVPDPDGGIPLDQVEPAAEIVKRFSTGAMSFGALSREAHETLAVAMNRMGGRSNSGEGGEDPGRAEPLPGGDSRRSAIRQVASGRFGVSIRYLAEAEEIQIKMAQGAKPGEGGQLPGGKVSDEIARVRGTTPGVMLISPPPHHDIYSIEDLAQLIHDLRNTNPMAEICVKLVSEAGVGTVAAGVAKAGADRILIAGADGGTGASPLTGIRHAGLPWELGLSESREILSLMGLRDGVILEADGMMRTGRDVAVAALLGADAYGFSTAPLITLGCIMMRKCHLNTCPVGVCTQDPELRTRFAGMPEHLVNYLFLVAEEVREVLATLGFRTLEEAIGRTDRLRPVAATGHWKASGVQIEALLQGWDGGDPVAPTEPHLRLQRRARAEAARRATLDRVLDRELLRRARGALDRARPVHIELPVENTDRTVGTLLSHEIARRFGEGGLPDGTIHVKLQGAAGQSLGAWLAEGVTLELEGDANDYVGKGLSGGRLILYPHRDALFPPERTVVAGNVVLYGAIRGQAFVRGIVGERFCVRNSGALAVVEGVGDHGCEYMTGGRAVILGPTGRNFAAGMSGGIAYVWDPDRVFPRRCNTELVELGRVEAAEDRDELRWLLERHQRFTGSRVARRILGHWEREVAAFVKVIPTEYRLALEARARRREEEDAAAAAHLQAPRRRRDRLPVVGAPAAGVEGPRSGRAPRSADGSPVDVRKGGPTHG